MFRLTREEGLGRVEYALLLILIVLIIIATLMLALYLVSAIPRRVTLLSGEMFGAARDL